MFGPTGKRLVPGNVAVSPDIMKRYPLGSPIVINGKTYTVGDVSYRSPGKPNFNTVEIWNGDPRLAGTKTNISGVPGTAPGSDRNRTVASDKEWTTSPGDRRFLPSTPPNDSPTIPSAGGRSASLTTDPNLDWTGTDETAIASSGGKPPPFITDPSEDWMGSNETAVASSGGRSPSLIDDPNQDWTGSYSQPVSSQGQIANFGGNMTIGQFLNTPLAFLRFGEGRGSTPGAGNVDVTQAGRDAYLNQSGFDSHAGPSGIGAEGYEPPEVAAMSEEQKQAAFAEAEQRGNAETAASANTASAGRVFGNLNSPTGQAVYFDGRNWRPVSGAPTDVRWDPNAPTGNFQASRTTRDFMAAGGYQGNPNNMASAATEGRFLMDEEGSPWMQGPMYGRPSGQKPFRVAQGGPAPYASNTNARNAWLIKLRGG